MQENTVVIDAQIHKLEQILGLFVNSGDRYALIDFPDHSNVGDSAIWLGEVILLKRLTGNLPGYVADLHSFDADELVACFPEGVIFIHGGGNFGDIWPQHQAFRERIVSLFPDRKVIQLPQSIHFLDSNNLHKAVKIFNNHPDFHLLVRDQKSYDFAARNFKSNVTLSPDCAFVLGAQPRKKTCSKYLYLLRTDSEKKQSYAWNELIHDNKDSETCDWLDDGKLFKWKAAAVAVIDALSIAFTQSFRFHYYQAKAKIRVKRGLRILSRGQVVITDRLHAHILSVLLNTPHYVLDNSYGKISAYIQCWTKEYALLQQVSSLAELKKQTQNK
ncbi:polysaccharide pyruvyl transferase family protein [Methylophilus luteus]|uniref:Polysaccharide pyruvyl transferase family protein n=1 Tax=Methylophilus luteus TaxID=640108 RepID=A0ABW3F431_9PROT